MKVNSPQQQDKIQLTQQRQISQGVPDSHSDDLTNADISVLKRLETKEEQQEKIEFNEPECQATSKINILSVEEQIVDGKPDPNKSDIIKPTKAEDSEDQEKKELKEPEP